MKNTGKIKRIAGALLITSVLSLGAAAQTGGGADDRSGQILGSGGRSGQTVGSGGFSADNSGQIFGSGGFADNGGMIGSGTVTGAPDSGSFDNLVQNWLEGLF